MKLTPFLNLDALVEYVMNHVRNQVFLIDTWIAALNDGGLGLIFRWTFGIEISDHTGDVYARLSMALTSERNRLLSYQR